MNTRMILVHGLTPIHCGTGQSIGAIDLPIARERPTNIPLIPGSSLKGVLRAAGEVENGSLHEAVFGPDTEEAALFAGSVQFSDANLACLPVRSIRGTFAWVTSPYMLRRLLRDASEAGLKLASKVPEPKEVTQALVAELGTVVVKEDKKVVFEDFDFGAEQSPPLKEAGSAIAKILFDDPDEQTRFVARLVLVHEDVMGVLLRSSVEVTARNRIDPDSGTVQKGALWTEEALPVESILSGVAVATPVTARDKKWDAAELLGHVESLVSKGMIQVGGKASVGRGMCRVKLVKGA